VLGVGNNYFLQVQFGQQTIPITPSMIREFTIVQDLNKFLPELRMRLADSTGAFTHLIPFDRNMSEVTVMLGTTGGNAIQQQYIFDIYRRYPTSEGILSGEYDAIGLMHLPGLYSPKYSRSFNQNVSDTIDAIGAELNVEATNISSSLDYTKSLIQPLWTDAQFLQYLCENLKTPDGHSNFRCWFSAEDSINTTLNFMSYDELLQSSVQWQYAWGDQDYENVEAIQTYEIIDNYKYLQVLGTQQQSSTYFNYATGQWVTNIAPLSKVPSLTPFYLVDSNDPVVDQIYLDTGRSNSFTSNFSGKVNSIYETRIHSLTKLWIVGQGNFALRPGDIVQVEAPSDPNNTFQYQYSGFWMVERIVLSFGDTLHMKLLLTRDGITTSSSTTLVPASNTVQGS